MGKPAFEARLDKIEAELLNTKETAREQPWRLCRRLAELIFLAIVVPRQGEQPLTEKTLFNTMQQLLTTLTSGIRDRLRKLRVCQGGSGKGDKSSLGKATTPQL